MQSLTCSVCGATWFSSAYGDTPASGTHHCPTCGTELHKMDAQGRAVRPEGTNP